MKIAAPSFVFPGTRWENALYLEGKVDEVELLYFTTKYPGDEPEPDEIAKLLSRNLSWQIHMPDDLDLSVREEQAVMERYADLLKPLNPSTYTVHQQEGKGFLAWLERFSTTVDKKVTVENVTGCYKIFDDLRTLPVSICFDVGHAVLHRIDIAGFMQKHADTITHFHLHGVKNGKDHVSLEHIDEGLFADVLDFAHENGCVISMEVFSLDDFHASLKRMVQYCERKDYPCNGRCEER